jgi:pimeloyl-ACP methyl ester carboxylesterase
MTTTIFSEVAYSPLAGTGEFASGVIAAGSAGFEITATINGIAQEGVRFEPTASGEYPMIFYCPGGAGGSRSLDDSRIVGNTDGAGAPPAGDIHTGLSGWTQWGDGYSVISWVSRGAGQSFNGSAGTPSADGSDGFGDPDTDVDDLAQAYNAALNFPKVDSKRTVLMGSSRGSMDALQMMIWKGITPDVCVLRAPLVKVEDWSEQQYGPASIPGFSDPGMTDPALRTVADQIALTKRTPVYRLKELNKTTKILVVMGAADPTIPRSWGEDTVSMLTQLGLDAQLVLVPGGDHAMLTGATAQFAAKAMEEFVEKHLPAPKYPKLVGALYVSLAAGVPTLDTDSKGIVSVARDGATVGEYLVTCKGSLNLRANKYIVNPSFWLNNVGVAATRLINVVYLNDNVFKVIIRDGNGVLSDINGGFMATITKYTE